MPLLSDIAVQYMIVNDKNTIGKLRESREKGRTVGQEFYFGIAAQPNATQTLPNAI